MKIVTSEQIDTIKRFIVNNELVVLPTDTVMGISSRVSRENLLKINQLKGRPETQPILVLVADITQITKSGWGSDIQNNLVKKLSNLGLITAIVDDHNNPNCETGQAVRLISPKHYLHQVISSTGPIYSTSANLSGQPVINDCEQAIDCFGSKIPLCVQLNNSDAIIEPSTIIDIRNNQFKIIREGQVKESEITSYINQANIDS